MAITQQAINPLLQRENNAHYPATSVGAILRLLEQADLGNITAQADLFTDMEERDSHIFAEMQKRKMAVAQLDWNLQAARDAGAREKSGVAQLETLLRDKIDFNTLIYDMADAIGHGFSAHEIEWDNRESGIFLPKKITCRPQRWFTVDRDTRENIRLRNYSSPDGEELQQFSWILHKHSNKTGQPAKQGIYRVLALPYLFKNFATKNWLEFCQLYGKPIRVLFHHERDEAKKQQLMYALESLGSSGVALLEGGTGDDLKTVNAATGEGAGFKALIDWCEASVSKAILGGTLTTQQGSSGNYATALIHDDVRLQIRNHDAQQIAETITHQLIGAIIEVNGLPIREPRLVFDTQSPEDLALYADAIPKLVAVGAQIPLRYINEKLKIPIPSKGEEILGAAPVPTQAPAIPQDPSAGLSAVTLSGNQPQFTKQQQQIENIAGDLIKKLGSPLSPESIKKAVLTAKNPQDLEKKLGQLLKNADLETYSGILERALFTADLLGYEHASH